jgi:RNA polymerase sigma-70 factor (ECF subfamily)
LLARANRAVARFETTTAWLNGAPAGLLEFDGELGAAVSVVVEDGRITRVDAIRNPHKLRRLEEVAELRR